MIVDAAFFCTVLYISFLFISVGPIGEPLLNYLDRETYMNETLFSRFFFKLFSCVYCRVFHFTWITYLLFCLLGYYQIGMNSALYIPIVTVMVVVCTLLLEGAENHV